MASFLLASNLVSAQPTVTDPPQTEVPPTSESGTVKEPTESETATQQNADAAALSIVSRARSLVLIRTASQPVADSKQPIISEVDRALEGQTIRKIVFTCDLPVCGSDAGIAAFQEIAGLIEGEPFQLQALRFAEQVMPAVKAG